MRRKILSSLYLLLWFSCFSAAQDRSGTKRFCFIGGNDLADSAAPNFAQYPAKHSAAYKPVPLDVKSNPIAKAYHAVIQEQTKNGPNFADHYRVAIWGCGTSCAQFVVVNLLTGRAITIDGVESVTGTHLNSDEFLAASNHGEWGFRYKKDSRLLVLVGALNEDIVREGAFYYVLDEDMLKLVHSTLGTRNTCINENER